MSSNLIGGNKKTLASTVVVIFVVAAVIIPFFVLLIIYIILVILLIVILYIASFITVVLIHGFTSFHLQFLIRIDNIVCNGSIFIPKSARKNGHRMQ